MCEDSEDKDADLLQVCAHFISDDLLQPNAI